MAGEGFSELASDISLIRAVGTLGVGGAFRRSEAKCGGPRTLSCGFCIKHLRFALNIYRTFFFYQAIYLALTHAVSLHHSTHLHAILLAVPHPVLFCSPSGPVHPSALLTVLFCLPYSPRLAVFPACCPSLNAVLHAPPFGKLPNTECRFHNFCFPAWSENGVHRTDRRIFWNTSKYATEQCSKFQVRNHLRHVVREMK